MDLNANAFLLLNLEAATLRKPAQYSAGLLYGLCMPAKKEAPLSQFQLIPQQDCAQHQLDPSLLTHVARPLVQCIVHTTVSARCLPYAHLLHATVEFPLPVQPLWRGSGNTLTVEPLTVNSHPWGCSARGHCGEQGHSRIWSQPPTSSCVAGAS